MECVAKTILTQDRYGTVDSVTSEHATAQQYHIVGIPSSHAQKVSFLGSIGHNGHLKNVQSLLTER